MEKQVQPAGFSYYQSTNIIGETVAGRKFYYVKLDKAKRYQELWTTDGVKFDNGRITTNTTHIEVDETINPLAGNIVHKLIELP